MATLKIKRISAGFYKGSYKSVKFQIVKYNTDVKDTIWWGFGIKNSLGWYSEPNDAYLYYSICKEGLIDYIDNIHNN